MDKPVELTAAINKAIEDHYPLSWSEQTSGAILQDAGAECLARIEEIRSFSNTPDHWIYASSHDRAYEAIQVLLREKYPFLTDKSVTWVATCAAWGWR